MKSMDLSGIIIRASGVRVPPPLPTRVVPPFLWRDAFFRMCRFRLILPSFFQVQNKPDSLNQPGPLFPWQVINLSPFVWLQNGHVTLSPEIEVRGEIANRVGHVGRC